MRPARALLRPARRAFLAACLALAALPLGTGFAAADAVQTAHGLSAFGELKYGPDFAHFDYVNPDAPKGGSITTTSVLGSQTFDSLNGYILKGDPADGLAAPFNLVYDSLMVRAMDEPDAVYSLVATHAEFIPGGDWIVFEIDPQARFSDGTPVTAGDVAFSFDLLKDKGHPAYRLVLRDVEKAEAEGNRVRYTFAKDAPTRDLPMTVATLPIFSKAFYTEHDFTEANLEVPLGSGPYRVGRVARDTSITYERREDYWAKDRPVNVGRWNFDRITFEYFKDAESAFESMTAGKLDLREEFSSKFWGTRYDFPALRDGRVIKGTLPDERPAGTQGYFINTRRAKFADPRVRRALDLAFDFEWSNKALFHGLYSRTNSFFENSDFEASGMPTPAEKVLLEARADALDPAILTDAAYEPPVTDGSGRPRRNLREARRLLDEAGWRLVNGKRVDENGEPLTIEFLADDGAFDRITNPYIRNLKLLGIDARGRRVDRPQFQRRQESFDFDIIVARFTFSATPGPELRDFFGSESATTDGSKNLSGIADPAVDALIGDIVAADSREGLHDAARALDRVLRAGHYWVPQWSKGSHTIAWWDKFGRPETKPRFARAILDTWWVKPGAQQ